MQEILHVLLCFVCQNDLINALRFFDLQEFSVVLYLFTRLDYLVSEPVELWLSIVGLAEVEF